MMLLLLGYRGTHAHISHCGEEVLRRLHPLCCDIGQDDISAKIELI